MKKLLLILLIFIIGCSKNEGVETVVEKNNNLVIAINYPNTGIKVLDKTVKNYVKNIYETFKEKYESYYSLTNHSELNIDYKYFKVDKYTNVILYTYVDAPNLEKTAKEVKAFVYDNDNNKLVSLNSFISSQKLLELLPKIKDYAINKSSSCILEQDYTKTYYNNLENFSIDSDNLTLFLNNKCDVVSFDVSLKDLNIHLNKEVINLKQAVKLVNNTIDPNKKVVAITFDDGPSKYTDKILDLLKENNANATFFVLGNKASYYQDTLIKMIELGNEIGNHSYNHKWLAKLDIDEIKKQINDTQDIIKNLTGYTPYVIRPTYGSVNNKVKESTKMPIILWNVDSNDWKIKNSKTIAKRVLKDIDDGDIVLFHDTYERTYKALQTVIPSLIEQGYQLVTVSELNEVNLIRDRIGFNKKSID